MKAKNLISLTKKQCVDQGYLWFILPFIALPLINKGVSLLSTLSFLVGFFVFYKNKNLIVKEIINNGYLFIFLALFIPICISSLDSLSPKLTNQTIWRFVRYSSYGIIAIVVFQTAASRNKFSTVLFWLIMIYCLDAICQWLFDYNIYGYNPVSDAWHSRVRGVFGSSYDLSFFLATLSPAIFFFLFEKVQQKQRLYLYIAPLCLSIFAFTIFLGGARTAILSLGLSIVLFTCYLLYHRKINSYKLIIVGGILLISLIAILFTQVDVVITRILYSINADSLADLTTNRTNLWNVAWTEIPNYWINGVGVRGFNTLYQSYPDSYKIFDAANHPHLHGLEVIIETGIIGFIPYMAVCFYLILNFFRSKNNNSWLLISFLAIMPINSYSALYEGNWLPVIMISIAIATAFSRPTK